MARAHLADALSHWQKPIDGFQTSALEFYSAVEHGLKERAVPGINFSRVKFKESGVVSGDRIYLRVKRKGLFFDIGAAPFGTGFFISWWMSRARPSPIVGTILLVALVFGLPWLTFKLLTLFFIVLNVLHILFILKPILNIGPTIFGWELYQVVALVAVFALLRKLAHKLSIDFDGLLSAVPIFGLIYKWAFARETYYAVDTMLMYQSLVAGVVTETIDKLTMAKGLRALTDDEKKPVMKDFLKKREAQTWTMGA